MRRVLTTALAGLLAFSGLALSVASASASSAAAAANTTLASANPLNFTPHVLDNRAYAVVQIGNTVVVGGNFTQIQSADTSQPIMDQPSLFSFNATTGAINQNFLPQVDGEVKALWSHPDGDKVYIAGSFTKINGQTASRLALLDLDTGRLVPAFKPPPINAEINDINRVGNRLYIGGDFDVLGPPANPIPRAHLAALNANTGAALDRMNVKIAGTNNGGGTTVKDFDISPDGKKLIAIGNFSRVNAKVRKQIAMFSLGGSRDKLKKWSTLRFANNCKPIFDSYMRDVDFSPDGKFFVVGTTGAYRPNLMCDTASRWETGPNKPNQKPTWVAYSGGDTFVSVEVTGPVAYVGGHFRWMNNPFAGDKAGSSAIPREGLAALDTRNGLPLSWNPTRARGYGVFDFYPTPNTLWAVSDTNVWANEVRPRVAGFPFGTGTTLPADRIGSLSSDVLMLGRPAAPSQSHYRTVLFDGAHVLADVDNSGPEAWSQVTAAFMVDKNVYTGWRDGTFKVRTFDGMNWGTPQSIPLNEGTPSTAGYASNFINDVGKLTGIFYEPTNSRIYYTMARDNNVYWRAFTPESLAVGAQRHVLSAAQSAKLGPAKVKGMFLTGNTLYFADKKTGHLKKIGFDVSKFVGAASVANSQIDWRAPGLALSTQPSSSGPNSPPHAQFTFDCAGLSCSFDSSLSSDPDGAIDDFKWDFNDGSVANGADPTHLLPTAGDYDVSLTVTDNRGDTDTYQSTVSVAPIPSAVAFRAADQSAPGDKSASSAVTVPSDVQAGDTMLLFASSRAQVVPDTPTGWTLLDTKTDGELSTFVYYKVAEASDSGEPVTVSMDGSGGASKALNLVAYSGVAAPPFTYSSDVEGTTFVADHTTPGVTVPTNGSWVVSYWADQTAPAPGGNPPVPNATTQWTAPAGQVVRGSVINTDSARVTTLLTDGGTATLSGPRSGLTAGTDSLTRKATMWTIVLQSQ